MRHKIRNNAIKCLLMLFMGIVIISGTAKAEDKPTPSQAPTASPLPGDEWKPVMNKQEVSAAVGTNVQLSVEGVEQDKNYSEQWVSSNTNIATVDQNGMVTMIAESTDEGIEVYSWVMVKGIAYKVSCQVYVSNPVLTEDSKTMKPKQFALIQLSGLRECSNVTYTSSNPEVAEVSGIGWIYADKCGQSTITIEADNLTLTYIITVSDPKINSNWFLTVIGKSKQLTVTGHSKTNPVVWSTTDASVATISGGKIVTKKLGNAKITAKVDGITLTCTVNVTYKRALSVINSSKKVLGTTYSQARRMSAHYYDCSSLVWRMYRKQSIYFGNRSWAPVAAEEARYMVRTNKVIAYKYVDESKLLPGDVLFFGKGYNGRYRNIYHTAIYIGNGQIIHANGKRVDYGYYSNYRNCVSVIARPLK